MINNARKIIPGIIGIGTLLFCCCDIGTGSDGTPNDSPALSTISAPDSVYAGYYRMYEPPCTVSVTFSYNPSKVTSIDVSATLDSGKSWIPVAAIAPGSAKAATVIWPLTTDAAAAYFNFFGYKEAYLKISDRQSGVSVNSAPFSIIGNAPFVLTSPLGGETFSVNDSIDLVYSVNTQLTAQIKPCIRPNDTTIQWKALESSTSKTTLTYQRGPIRSFVQKFTLAYFDSTLGWSTEWTDHALQIMLKDYGSGGNLQFSGLITIIPD